MIPFIRSINELMLITQSRSRARIWPKDSKYEKPYKVKEFKDVKEDIKGTKYKDLIYLPKIPKIKRQKWIKSKEAVSRFFDELDYNNQIQSSYDLTLLEIQKSYDHHDVA